MSFWQNIVSVFHRYFSISSITVVDIIEIIIISVLFYYLLTWFRKTRAWSLFKGLIVILVLLMLAAIFNLNTILWLASRVLSVGVIGLIIIFQPELRHALESLGGRKMFRGLFTTDRGNKKRFSDKTMEEILHAVTDLSKDRTGALICIELDVSLSEYEHTGIAVDAVVSSALVENIFEDKTPLHDGAVIVRDDRIVAATCYLPMSSSRTLNKKYGTRHRAALGLSEVTDSFTIVVSEETGAISVAYGGELKEDMQIAELKNRMIEIQNLKGRISWLIRREGGESEDAEREEVSSEVDRK